jgi:hypothetical protein
MLSVHILGTRTCLTVRTSPISSGSKKIIGLAARMIQWSCGQLSFLSHFLLRVGSINQVLIIAK